ncbi:MAG TPA: hypothetical protein VJS14_17185 [Enterobacteriaceae bacterium]|nr:hypothetical protein [Enterobacteriaceae bacterium]
MMENETKDVVIGTHAFTVVQLDPWRRLTFIADLQKEFLAPLLAQSDASELSGLFNDSEKGEIDVMAIVSGFSSAIDGKSLEKWTRRVLSDGLVIYTRPDGQRAKLSFTELTKFFTNPTDIIVLLKEAIVLNMVDIGELMKSFSSSKVGEAKVTEA